MPASADVGRWQIPQALDAAGNGVPIRVAIEFDASIADYVRAREWHPSQQLQPQVDGTVRVVLDVAASHALQSWILSFGPLARVVSPGWLAEQILISLDQAREKYAPRMPFELPIVLLDEFDAQDTLPFPATH
ncbi:MAG TPA: WYL domain-containing protein [Vicinamibacterales bacterium]|jgi:predicted DNA-binding transcriptional regulator YafY|nr:WYL domain-containing protein [Vicinamibacterales bacterium]